MISPDDLVLAQAEHLAGRFSSSVIQASAVLFIAASGAVGTHAPTGGTDLWMSLMDSAAGLLRAERARLRLPPGDFLLRDLAPWAHLIDLRQGDRLSHLLPRRALDG